MNTTTRWQALQGDVRHAIRSLAPQGPFDAEYVLDGMLADDLARVFPADEDRLPEMQEGLRLLVAQVLAPEMRRADRLARR